MYKHDGVMDRSGEQNDDKSKFVNSCEKNYDNLARRMSRNNDSNGEKNLWDNH